MKIYITATLSPAAIKGRGRGGGGEEIATLTGSVRCHENTKRKICEKSIEWTCLPYMWSAAGMAGAV
jgi:hypothetical protein